MTATQRPPLARISDDGALPWTIGVSALVHAAGIAALALLPTRLPAPVALESYTVDLVAPSAVGGTNLVAGPPKNQPAKAAPAPPKEVRRTEEAAVLPRQPPVEMKAREEHAAAERRREEAKMKPEQRKAPAKVEAPPPAQPPAQAAAAKPALKPEPKPPVVPAAEPAEAKQAALPVAKKVPPKPAPQAAARPEPVHEAKAGPKREAKPERAPVQAAGAPATTPAVTKARPEADRRIAAAVARRAQQLQREGAAAAAKSEVEQRIAAAVERRARIVQGGSADGGGPITSGPGSGAGGVVRGVDYILYRGHMEERIKAAWVWAGANRSLRAVVRFNLLPSGEIVNVQIVTASGDPSYDASIERALRRASPLDPPPERYRDEFSTVELEFRPEDLQS